MSRIAISTLLVLLALAAPLRAQQVVDRIVARVEGDILTLSEIRELGRFQQLLEGRAASDEKLLQQLLEQWIVQSEATASRFPQPSPEEVQSELARIQKEFASPEAYRARLRELGLTEAALRRFLERQLYFARFLDYRFRPGVQAEPAEVEKYYQEELVPRLTAQKRAVPPLETVEEQIRELLTQREISLRAARWLEESRSRLRVEIAPGGVAR